MATCKQPGCGAPILWGKRKGYAPSERGAFVALEPQPSAHGIHAIVDGRVVPDGEAPKDAPRYVPHAVFCAAAGKARRSPLARD